MAKEKKDQAAPAPAKGEKAAKGAKPAAEAKGGKGDKAADKGDKGKGKKDKKGGPAAPEVEARAIPRLLENYRRDVVPRLRDEFHYSNGLQVPRLVKIVVNMGLGEATSNPKVVELAIDELRAITGQAPVSTRARKSIATFKLRAGMRIGAMVTLRGPRMWEFLDRLMNVALPRVRDFRGVSTKAFDGRGNYTLGIREEIIFPEINYDKLDKIKGLNISIVTTARTDEESLALLKYLGMPFAR